MKKAEVLYSPEVYKLLTQKAQEMDLQGMLAKQFGNSEHTKTIQNEFLKMMSLSPKDLHFKIQGINHCNVNQNLLSHDEANILNEYFGAYSSQDFTKGQVLLSEIMNLKSNSKSFQAITTNLASSGKAGIAQSSDEDSENKTHALVDFTTGAGVIAGAVIGMAIAGPVGAIIGAVAGGFIGRAIGKFLKNVFGSGVVAGPNGEDCQPPFLEFPGL
ncbi:MAG: hypothetical protein AAGA77_24250 [Bacteroidota bacterium]